MFLSSSWLLFCLLQLLTLGILTRESAVGDAFSSSSARLFSPFTNSSVRKAHMVTCKVARTLLRSCTKPHGGSCPRAAQVFRWAQWAHHPSPQELQDCSLEIFDLPFIGMKGKMERGEERAKGLHNLGAFVKEYPSIPNQQSACC